MIIFSRLIFGGGLIFLICRLIYKFLFCTVTVDAECVQGGEKPKITVGRKGGRSTTNAMPVYCFTLNKKKQTVCSNSFAYPMFEKDIHHVKLRVDPQNPWNYFYPRGDLFFSSILGITLSFFLWIFEIAATV